MGFTAGGHGQVKTESSLTSKKRTDPEVGTQQSRNPSNVSADIQGWEAATGKWKA